MTAGVKHILKRADFSDKQINAIVRVINHLTKETVDLNDMETALSKLELRIVHRIYVAFAAQTGLLAAIIFGLFELLI